MADPRFGGPSRTPARSNHTQRPGASSIRNHPDAGVVRLTPTRVGNVRAFVTVALRFGHGDNSLAIDGFKVVQEPGKRAWVAPPAQERQRVDPQTGQTVTKWYPVVTIPDSWKAAVDEVALLAWERYQKTGELPQDGGGRP